MSYSTDGILTEEEIEEIFKKYGNPETFRKNRIKYRKYKSKQYNHQALEHYLF